MEGEVQELLGKESSTVFLIKQQNWWRRLDQWNWSDRLENPNETLGLRNIFIWLNLWSFYLTIHLTGKGSAIILKPLLPKENLRIWTWHNLDPLSTNPTKWSNKLKQFVGCSQQIVWICLTILWGWHLRVKSYTVLDLWWLIKTSFQRICHWSE